MKAVMKTYYRYKPNNTSITKVETMKPRYHVK